MKILNVGGVPEHFNLPWHWLIESGDLVRQGIDVRWRDFPDGSGAMATALSAGELDVAMLLTEAAVAGIARGGSYSVVSLYTQSPLLWGIHVPAGSSRHRIADVRGATYAISRLGSGSHLMCFVHAKQNSWSVDALKFVAVRSLQGAIEAFAAGTAEVFFWEKFMTKPVVDAGVFRRIGEFVAPWPAWVVCVSQAALADKQDLIARLLPQVFGMAARLARSADSARDVADRYGLQVADVSAWLSMTRWATKIGIETEAVDAVVDALKQLGLIAPEFDSMRVVAALTK